MLVLEWFAGISCIIFAVENLVFYTVKSEIEILYHTSHSVIFQLYSDETVTVVQFPNLNLLQGTDCHEQLRVFSMQSLPQDVFNLLAIRGPTRGEGMPGIEPKSSDPQFSPLPLCHRGG